ncbi:sister chromatid cohesion protein DCC1-like [Olea europaea var. sylvestris]|uniref:sister chromatid cohesion protein DCC1-like n=1 Tax=Olea europaea var. sylvestris TaxID=158386 RepID=UPI000C1D16EF|nr:sister chromatid cohesion protein DCC1-like [Olea europaea var. sylvestris]XP_022897245.1 sister chromatid cohesion protein DCC1-like [Olea europaea var. sylvestris]XP_022897246.1 sister chromatid cohesion protein DCC1-like [Olea europaea var. sylvestris]XP_022897247.1 sister chromatid cohesion protein DCC1-like [Olea europaea var. sylvestris]XP_022897248.1 sister chromatid cohesion protein DCC1-like [Olea europaea var. sylvestris]XP_022897249.1 sister chromatid cohesion protein DCC1-like [
MDMEHLGLRSTGGAEAVLGLQPNSTMSIAYHSLFGSHNDITLLEIDETLIPDILQQRVTIRGQPDEDAVLCTQSKTYALKYVGTSNSVLLIPPSDKAVKECNDITIPVAAVFKVAPGIMEVVEVAPKLDKLKFLLSQNPYSFDEASDMDISHERMNTGLYSWDNLVDEVQASNEELRSGLQALSAVEIYGYWRVLDDKYMDMILNILLHDVILNDWSFNALNEDEVLRALETDGFPCNIAMHCLKVYGNKVEEHVGGSCVWQLEERRICVHFAREILKSGKMKVEKFMAEWIRKVPDGMHASFDMLEGEVLTEKLGIETLIYHFSVSSLPSTPAERFKILFRERQKWEWKDLQPYVRDLRVPGLSAEAILLKYTRRTQPTVDAEPIFSAR